MNSAACHLTKSHPKKFQASLLKWFDGAKRPMPWRSEASAYRTWVSEMMLQQTQVQTVIPYFERWMKKLPDVQTLAKAPLDKVLKLWEGLGYYSRARNLHKAAQIVVRIKKGVIPDTVNELLELPGIGPYSAGAIASIAFNRRVPLVDGNVARVLARVFLVRKDISDPNTQSLFYRIADSLVPENRPGDFNQALMELGALICTPEAPQCTKCPIDQSCLARQRGVQEKLPVKLKKTGVRRVDLAVAVISESGRLLVRQRDLKGIWAGLWEFPSLEIKRPFSESKFSEVFESQLKIKMNDIKALPSFTHRLTHRTIQLHPFRARKLKSAQNMNRQLKWVSHSKMKKLSFPVPFQKLMNEMTAHD